MATSPAVLRRDDGNHTSGGQDSASKESLSGSFDKVRKLDTLERATEQAREQLNDAKVELDTSSQQAAANDMELQRLRDIEATLNTELADARKKLGFKQAASPGIKPGKMAEDAALQVAELQERFNELCLECDTRQEQLLVKKTENDDILSTIEAQENKLLEVLKAPRAADMMSEAQQQLAELESQIQAVEESHMDSKVQVGEMFLELNKAQRQVLDCKGLLEKKQGLKDAELLEVQALGDKLQEVQAEARAREKSALKAKADEHEESRRKLAQVRYDNKARAATHILELNEREGKIRLAQSELVDIQNATDQQAVQVTNVKSLNDELTGTQREMIILRDEVQRMEQAASQIQEVRNTVEETKKAIAAKEIQAQRYPMPMAAADAALSDAPPATKKAEEAVDRQQSNLSVDL